MKTILMIIALGNAFIILLNTNFQNHEVIHLKNRREIFVDQFFIEKLISSKIELHQPIDEGMPIKFG